MSVTMETLKVMFDDDEIDCFEKYYNMTSSERLQFTEDVKLERNKYEDMKSTQSVFARLYEEITDVNTDLSIQALSEKLSTLADSMGFSKEAREMFIETTKVQNVISYVSASINNDGCPHRIVGSKAEGTANRSSGPDTDMLMFNTFIRIYSLSQNPKTNLPYLRMVGDNKTSPGYTKLQLFHNGHAVSENNVKDYKAYFILHKLKVDRGRVFLSNQCVDSNDYNIKNMELVPHGPAGTLELKQANTSFDHVPAYICKSLPGEVMPWFKRKRKNGWTSEETMKRFKQMGCVVVPIGHTNSPEQKLQWRLSFTNQEMYLMHNLNMTQYKCYVILKYFNNTFIKKQCPDSLCSYHIKTVLFYTIENSKPSIWEPKYLAYVVLKCMHTLSEWVAEMNCPNYFIPQENMFETKLNQQKKETLSDFFSFQFKNQIGLRLLLHVNKFEIQDKMEVLLLRFNCRRALLENQFFEIAEHFQQKGYPLSILSIEKIIQCLKIFTDDNKLTLSPILPEYTAFPELLILAVFLMRYTQDVQDCQQQFLKEMPTFEDIVPVLINCSALRSAFGQVQSFFHGKIASYAFQNRQNRHQLTEQDKEKIDHHVQRAGKTDALHTRLKQASCLYIDGHHELVDLILEKTILMEFDMSKLPVVCTHSYPDGISDILQSKKLHANLRSIEPHHMTVDNLNDILFTCLTFDSIETLIVPGPLPYENLKMFGTSSNPETDIFWQYLSHIVIDPIIYLYYLQYKNKEAMQDKPGKSSALCYLENIILDSLHDTKHFDTALNSLGHIYVTKGWKRLAISCFRWSLKKESLYNSAKWQIMLLLFG